MLRRAFESVLVERAIVEAIEERLEIQVVPLFMWSRLTMKSLEVSAVSCVQERQWALALGRTRKKDVRSSHWKSPSMYASANPMSAKRKSLIQKASFLTTISTRGTEVARRGKPVDSSTPPGSLDSLWPNTWRVSPGSSTRSNVPVSTRERRARTAGLATARAGAQVQPPSVPLSDSAPLESERETPAAKAGMTEVLKEGMAQADERTATDVDAVQATKTASIRPRQGGARSGPRSYNDDGWHEQRSRRLYCNGESRRQGRDPQQGVTEGWLGVTRGCGSMHSAASTSHPATCILGSHRLHGTD